MLPTEQWITMLQAHATLSFPLPNKQVKQQASKNTQASLIPESVRSSLISFYNYYQGNLTIKTLIASQQSTLD
jgi:hypothetical protein